MNRLSFAKNPAPMLVGVVRERTAAEAIAAMRNCKLHGAGGIDLHLSCLNKEGQTLEELRRIVESSRLPILALHYNSDYDMKQLNDDEETRVALMLRAVEAGAAGLDMQGYTFDPESKRGFRQEFADLPYSFIKTNPVEVVMDSKVIDKQKALIERVHAMGAEVLLSCHPGVFMTCEQVVDLALFLEQRNPDIIKIITLCRNEDDLAESFKTMITLKKEVKTAVHFHCFGQAGILSRIINPILGSQLVFCVDEYTPGSNLEQIDLQTAGRIIENIKKLQ